ncbi:amidohydrolase family protein [Luteipulveratus mongoliensis]|uniref:Amidohydrolase-related domain-containing protein n=1 Tax=Luteipulveratus mongoliensis TaxID=571913 RepID=A0A0K1JG05_9MICO|nr:amidohydrolase family protein [Luteipulveratus mongoliensis]AKU15652.1 hypothetical protein VV02_06955 [Luteipulveratus mongoliensis]
MTLRVDAHHHLWDPARRAYPWLDGAAMTPIRRPFEVADLGAMADEIGVTRTVLVQTVPDVGETRQFLLDADDSDGLIAGVVGWVDLTADDVADSVERLRSGPGGRHLVGLRHQAQDEPDPTWLTRPDVVRGLRAATALDLAYDILVTPPHWEAALTAARSLPQARLVLDHAGKPPIASGDLEPWRRWIAELAREPQVAVKLSGLVTEADWHSWVPSDLRPVVDHVLECFGPDRVMLGSDWPVCELAGPVTVSWRTTVDLLPVEVHDRVLGQNAAEWYALSAT